MTCLNLGRKPKLIGCWKAPLGLVWSQLYTHRTGYPGGGPQGSPIVVQTVQPSLPTLGPNIPRIGTGMGARRSKPRGACPVMGPSEASLGVTKRNRKNKPKSILRAKAKRWATQPRREYGNVHADEYFNGYLEVVLTRRNKNKIPGMFNIRFFFFLLPNGLWHVVFFSVSASQKRLSRCVGEDRSWRFPPTPALCVYVSRMRGRSGLAELTPDCQLWLARMAFAS